MYANLPFHPLSEQLIDLMQVKTQSSNKEFFRVLVPYYWALAASTMHAKIVGFDSNPILINFYGVNLAPSGTGKGVSQGVMERQVLRDFQEVFLNETFVQSANQSLFSLSTQRAVRSGKSQEEELTGLAKQFHRLGAPAVWFGEMSSTAAIKQYRQKLLLAQIGAINLTVDEIGVNLVGQTEPLNLYLELYDHGRVKEKLSKSTADNFRDEIMDGATPTNMLLFGTQSSLMDGSVVEKRFMEMLEMGYARRCFFGYVENANRSTPLSVEDMFNNMRNTTSNSALDSLATKLGNLAKPHNIGKEINIADDEVKEILAYQLYCQQQASKFKANQTKESTEMTNRYFKVLKLAGAYAFIDGSPDITPDHIKYAIALAEYSGESFIRMINPKRNYVKLAEHLADNKDKEFTLVDLESDLPFFAGGRGQKDDMISLATAWGYTNSILIKKRFEQGILFLRGDGINETTLDKLNISYSNHVAHGYMNDTINWDNLVAMVQMVHPESQNGSPIQWCNHHFKQGHRLETNAIDPFNLFVVDVDKGKSLDLMRVLMRKYQCIIYTTKSHGIDGHDCYRLILPMSHMLTLDAEDYKTFYMNVLGSLPLTITVDEMCHTRSKKWLAHPNGQIFVNEGELFDVIPFVPRTTKEVEYQEKQKQYRNLDNLERWIVANTGDGNRNNQLYRYACTMRDAGKDPTDISRAVKELNNKLPDKLSDDEIMSTIMRSIQNKS